MKRKSHQYYDVSECDFLVGSSQLVWGILEEAKDHFSLHCNLWTRNLPTLPKGSKSPSIQLNYKLSVPWVCSSQTHCSKQHVDDKPPIQLQKQQKEKLYSFQPLCLHLIWVLIGWEHLAQTGLKTIWLLVSEPLCNWCSIRNRRFFMQISPSKSDGSVQCLGRVVGFPASVQIRRRQNRQKVCKFYNEQFTKWSKRLLWSATMK